MLHIVHPYIYKFKEDSLVIGPIDEFKERDRMLSGFLLRAINNSYPIVCHERIEDFNTGLEHMALRFDDLFEPLFHPKVKWIGTDSYGLPIQDNKPEDMSEGAWEEITNMMCTNSEFTKLARDAKEVIICGGEYNRCERNFMKYIQEFQGQIENRFYIPDLSVVVDHHLVDSTNKELRKIGFKPLTYNEAIERISN